MPGPKPKRTPTDTTRLKADIATDMSNYQKARTASITVGGLPAADSAAKSAFGSMMARSDSLDRSRSTPATPRKKFTNHAAHGDSVTFPPSTKHQRIARYGC